VTAQVISLDERRRLREMKRQLDRMQLQVAAMRLERNHEIRDRLLFSQIAEVQARVGPMLRLVAGPLRRAIAAAMVQQATAGGSRPDFELALALILDDREFLRLGELFDEVLADLPAALLRAPPELIEPPKEAGDEWAQ
jgi:hypothetical protein